MSFTKSLSIKHIDSENKLRKFVLNCMRTTQKRRRTILRKKDKKDKPWIPFSHKNDFIREFFFPFLARKLSSCFYSSVRTKLSVRNKHIISELPSFTNSNQRQVKGTGTYAGTSSLNVPEFTTLGGNRKWSSYLESQVSLSKLRSQLSYAGSVVQSALVPQTLHRNRH